VTLVARPGDATVAELPGRPTPFSPYGVVSSGGDPGSVPAVAERRAGVQDEGSQLVALALASAPLDGPDVRWLDLCAGPGGKAALLAALAAERGARVVANEVQPHRAELVRRALGLDSARPTSDSAPLTNVEVTVADGTAPPWEAGSFDRVLVDAPCTGLGALRRRPEARWRRQPEDLHALLPLQRALLASAVDLVRPGGVVLYATCSPVLAETRDVIGSLLVKRDDVKLGDAAAQMTASAGLRADVPDCAGPLRGTVQLWPHRHGTDSMFLALLRKG
jgi:16S rRNA (cytosine967-C5)-methyltransferase